MTGERPLKVSRESGRLILGSLQETENMARQGFEGADECEAAE
jgi:hypothetical protein